MIIQMEVYNASGSIGIIPTDELPTVPSLTVDVNKINDDVISSLEP